MIKSILIYGSYGGENYGDEIILDTILQNLKAKYDVSVLVPGDSDKVSRMHDVNTISLWSSPRPQKTFLGKLTKFFKSILMLNRNIKRYDMILVGGGNMIMDLFPESPLITFLLCCLSKIHHKKICFFGCGAGPIYRTMSKMLFRTSFKMANLITLRDSGSYKLVKGLCPSNKKIFECADLIFSNDYFDKDLVSTNQQKMECIAINIVAYNRPGYYPSANKEEYDNYCSFITNIINYLANQEDVKEILLFTTSHPHDDYALKDIESHVDLHQGKKIISCCKYTSFIQLSAILKNYDLIITSRLHSLLLSICLSKKVIPLIYQEKVQNFVYENNIDSISIDIRKASLKSFYKFKLIFEKIKDNPLYYSNKIINIKEKCVTKSNKNFELIKTKLLRQNNNHRRH